MPQYLIHPHTQKFVSKRSAADRYGKNPRTITRWTRNPKLGFPKPAMINGHWYFEEAELDEFDRRLAAARLPDLSGHHQAENKKEAQFAGGAS